MKRFLQTVEQTLAESGVVTTGQKICVALSGGPDSTALLASLIALAPKLSLTITACHFDHAFRQNSGADADFAKSMAQRFDVPLVTKRNRDGVPANNLQQQARTMRYKFYEQVLADGGADLMATGHTADDSVETSIIWMLRGAGPGAFGHGIPMVRGPYIRPLIRVRKRELLAWLKAESIPFVCDQSNETDRYLRNRVRRRIIPAMEHESPGAVKAILRLAALTKSQDEVIRSVAAERLNAWGIEAHGGEVTLPLVPLVNEPVALRYAIYRLACQMAGLESLRVTMERTESIDRLLTSYGCGKIIELPGGYEVMLDHAGLTIRAVAGPATQLTKQSFVCPMTIKTTVGEMNIVTDQEADGEKFSLDAVPNGAVVRSRLAGDYLLLKGDRGKKMLKKYLIDKKIPKSYRDQLPLISAGSEVLYVAGLFMSPRLKATEGDGQCAFMQWRFR